MLRAIQEIEPFVGDTPLRKMKVPGVNLFAKLEYNNFSGSIKDRAALNILANAARSGELHEGSFVVESSSGNFAVALMSICNLLGLKFIAVIDPNINSAYEELLRISCEVVKETELDHSGGYLLNRIRKVKEICASDANAYWPNQYSNPQNYLSYYNGLGKEICASFEQLDYLFIAVSSCGTITGTSKRIKEQFPHIKVIAVDVEGSVIFSNEPAKRFVSGIGASKVPDILKEAHVDEVFHVSHLELIQGCRELLSEQSVFAGASSGACYYAVKNHFKAASGSENALFICPDKGYPYLNTIYNDQWVSEMTPTFNNLKIALPVS